MKGQLSTHWQSAPTSRSQSHNHADNCLKSRLKQRQKSRIPWKLSSPVSNLAILDFLTAKMMSPASIKASLAASPLSCLEENDIQLPFSDATVSFVFPMVLAPAERCFEKKRSPFTSFKLFFGNVFRLFFDREWSQTSGCLFSLNVWLWPRNLLQLSLHCGLLVVHDRVH